MATRAGVPGSLARLRRDPLAIVALVFVALLATASAGVHQTATTSSGEYGTASKSAIEGAGLGVEKTGNNPFHYTVTLPGPVDAGLAGTFNRVFYGSPS